MNSNKLKKMIIFLIINYQMILAFHIIFILFLIIKEINLDIILLPMNIIELNINHIIINNILINYKNFKKYIYITK